MTRQNYYKQRLVRERLTVDEQLVLELIRKERHDMPHLGCRKLMSLVESELKAADAMIGRDRFFGLLRRHHMLPARLRRNQNLTRRRGDNGIRPRIMPITRIFEGVCQKSLDKKSLRGAKKSIGCGIERPKRGVHTTNSRHGFAVYSNSAKDLQVTGPHQLLVSDITYIRTNEGFMYLSLVMDAFSRKIVGYDCSDNLEMEGVMRAGARAIRELSSPGSFMSYHFLIEKHNVRVRIRATYRNRNVVQCGVKAPTESTQRRPDTRYEEVSGSLPSHGEIGDEPKIFQIFGFIR